MICHCDTSTFVPLRIDEPSSPAYRWITADQEVRALRVVDRLWDELYAIEPTKQLIRRTAALTSSEALRGYDALHCASAEDVNDRDMLFASGDRQHLKAGENLGFYVADVNDLEFVR